METCDHAGFMQAAYEEAVLAGAVGDVPVGAVVVREGEIIGRGHNRREQDQDATAHAEIVALRQACEQVNRWHLGGCTMYVTLEPCAMCAGALVLARIRLLVYGAADAKAGACGSVMNLVQHAGLNHRMEIISGILKEESSALLRGFFAERRQK